MYEFIAATLQRFSEHPVEIRIQFGFHCKCNPMAQLFLSVCFGSIGADCSF